MTKKDALRLVSKAVPGASTVTVIPSSALPFLSVNDIPHGVSLTIGDEEQGQVCTPWEGAFCNRNGELVVFLSLLEERNTWHNFLSLPFYLDIMRRAIETRNRLRKDVEFCNWEDNGSSICLEFMLLNLPSELKEANEEVQSRLSAIEEAAIQASREAGRVGSEFAKKVSGWGNDSLEALVERIEQNEDPNEKGRALEELSARLFETVPGFLVTGRLRTSTETEEIDLSLINGSDDPVLKREEAFILVECKNWTNKCGRPEFSLLREKMLNRSDRCSLAFLISWNGFAETVTKEMLRGSRERLMVVPLEGSQIREAIRGDTFVSLILAEIHRAVHL